MDIYNYCDIQLYPILQAQLHKLINLSISLLVDDKIAWQPLIKYLLIIKYILIDIK